MQEQSYDLNVSATYYGDDWCLLMDGIPNRGSEPVEILPTEGGVDRCAVPSLQLTIASALGWGTTAEGRDNFGFRDRPDGHRCLTEVSRCSVFPLRGVPRKLDEPFTVKLICSPEGWSALYLKSLHYPGGVACFLGEAAGGHEHVHPLSSLCTSEPTDHPLSARNGLLIWTPFIEAVQEALGAGVSAVIDHLTDTEFRAQATFFPAD